MVMIANAPPFEGTALPQLQTGNTKSNAAKLEKAAKAADSVFSKSEFWVGVGALLAGRCAGNYFDPEGSRTKRSFLKRFFTITLLDNGLFCLRGVVGNMNDLTVLSKSNELLGVVFAVMVASQVLEWGRWVGAWALDKTGNEDVRAFAQFLGPRDFYAR